MRNWPPDCKTWRLLQAGGGTPGMWKNLAFAWHHRWGANAYVGGLQRTALTASGDAKNIYDESAGLIRQWPANALGWGAPQEPARTNVCLRSHELDNTTSAWSHNSITVTANDLVAPDGTTTAEKLATATNGSSRSLQQNFTSTNAEWCYSLYVKQGNLAVCEIGLFDASASGFIHRVSFTFATEAVATTSGTGKSGFRKLANGWYRIWVTGTFPAAGTDRAYFYIGGTGATVTGDYCYAVGGQIEAGSYPTSSVTTAASSVARSADAARIVDSNLFGRLSDAGALLAVFDFQYLVAADTRVCALTNADDATDNYAAILVNSSAAIRGETRNNAGSQTLLSSGVTQVAKTAYAAAVAWAENYQGAAANGVSTSAGAGGGITGLDRLELGGLLTTDTRPGVSLFSVLAFSRALSVDELRLLTANPGALKNAS